MPSVNQIIRALLVACGVAGMLHPQRPAPATGERVLEITARDFVLELPTQGVAGVVSFRFRNRGQEPHYMRLVRIDGDHSIADFADWRRNHGPFPSWLIPSGGIGTIAPGEVVEYSARLPQGKYIAYCGHPSPDGIPHVDKGMYREFVLQPGPDSVAPSAEATITVADDRLDLSQPLRRGPHTVRVENVGSRSHQVLLVLLTGGVSSAAELAWFRNGSAGPRPGHPVGGVIELGVGADAWVTFTLRSGSYVLLSSSVGPDGKRDFDAGLVRTFTID